MSMPNEITKNTLENSKINISYSFGMVDLLHYGHIRALKKARVGADLWAG